MKVGKLNILGHSISGVETCLIVPEYGAVFDIGHCPSEAVKHRTVFITHGHPDHLAGAIQHAAARSLIGAAPSRFIMPMNLTTPVKDLLKLWNSFQNHEFKAEILGLPAGGWVAIGKGLIATTFATDHTMPSQGYLISRRTQKLKPQYAGLEGSEIAKLRLAGEEVSTQVETPEFAYTGDTRPWVFEHYPSLLETEVLVTEATFVEQGTLDMAEAKGHTHLAMLATLAHRFDKVGHLVLTHFSQRYDRAEVEAAVQGALPPELLARTHLTEIP
ncbi:MAG: hypothetical protein A2Y38_23450 [Spirochaetes bacterium GWB1_59_5]|nr:MAG: hypothetical protein A2Y38_23450 [Spirochaetes bacterium GWB1_59_5]